MGGMSSWSALLGSRQVFSESDWLGVGVFARVYLTIVGIIGYRVARFVFRELRRRVDVEFWHRLRDIVLVELSDLISILATLGLSEWSQ